MVKNKIQSGLYILIVWLLYIIGMLPIINLCVVVYWLFNQREKEISDERYPKLTIAIGASSFFTLWFILGIGIAKILFFIPDSLENVDIEIGCFLGLIGTWLFFHIYEKYEELNDIVDQRNKQVEELEEEIRELKCGYHQNKENC